MPNYDRYDLKNALLKCFLIKSDTVFIHSNIGFFGAPENFKNKNDICELFFDTIFEVIGPNGTVVVPTFTYSFQKRIGF